MTTPPQQLIRVLGPSAWNSMIHLDHLPEACSQMVVARQAWDAVGGTSAGKAVHLHDLGLPVQLITTLGDDDNAQRIRDALPPLDIEVLPAEATEHHVNLMTPRGERLSIYTTPPAEAASPPSLDDLRDSRTVVLDLAGWTRTLATAIARDDLDVWTDLHDVAPDSDWHAPFWQAARVVQCSHDNLPDPVAFLHHLVNDGVRLAICTRGSNGAIAVDQDHREYQQPAIPCEVVDTNGAGDAFFAGVMAATLDGAPVGHALDAGAHQSLRALRSRDIGPGLRGGRRSIGSRPWPISSFSI